ncbi:MAG: SurA N-terminal domain-containing protein, partial [Pseudomonadota bacterium]
MLTVLKRLAGTWVAKALLGVLVLSFAVWGITGASFNFATGTVASVGSTNIRASDFQREFALEIETLGRQAGRRLTIQQARQFNLDRQVLFRLINQAALDDQAKSFGLGVSTDEMDRFLIENESLRGSNGQFDPFLFRQLLISQGLSEKDYFEELDRNLERQQLVDALVKDIAVPDALLSALGAYRNERRTVSYIALDERDIEPVGEPDTAALENYFETNQSRYRAPEYRALTFIHIDEESVSAAASITDEDARKYYEDNKDRYTQQERREIRRITFDTLAEATTAAEAISGGKTFDDLVADRGLTATDVTLGTLAKGGVLDTKLADAAFALGLNETSGVVNGDFGPVIVNIAAIEPAGVTSFEEASAEIKQFLAQGETNRVLTDTVDAIEDARAEGATFEEISTRMNVALTKIEAVARDGSDRNGNQISDLPARNNLLEEAFATDVGVENDLIEIGRTGYVWFEVTEIETARDRTLDEVRTRAIENWKAFEVEKAVSARAEELLERISGDTPLLKVAEEENLIVLTVEEVERGRPSQGLPTDAVEAAFQGPLNHSAVTGGERPGNSIILQVTGVEAGTGSVEDRQIPAIREAFQNDILGVYISLVRNREGTTVNENAFQ